MTQSRITADITSEKAYHSVDVAPGQSQILETAYGGLATIVVAPGVGGTVHVEFSCSKDVDTDTALWANAEGLAAGGVVSALTLDCIPSTIAGVRVTAAGAAARVELAQ